MTKPLDKKCENKETLLSIIFILSGKKTFNLAFSGSIDIEAGLSERCLLESLLQNSYMDSEAKF